MTDLTAQTTPAAGLDWKGIGTAILRGEIGLAVLVIGILVMLILPVPTFLLDGLLAISITSSVLVLMTALLIRKPLEFSVFPSVLLLTTLFRLGLNVASTRLILAEGHNGPDAAGAVIQAFGGFVMQGNFVIGVIVFVILVLVNFMVISRGSTRIAEVAARFTLDSMPGKQLAIDSDLSSGLINEDEARRRRKELEQESGFFGAMDGASKFVRGDAMAGIIITLVNVIGGMIIGVAQNGISFEEAASVYTLLTVGDGLVSQIPALIISVAAGILVSKAGVEGAADKALVAQLAGRPEGLAIAATCAGIAGLLPGMPFLAFSALAAGLGYWAFRINKANQAKSKEADKPKPAPPPAEEPISTALAMDDLRVELGFSLLPLANDVAGRKLTDQIKAVRRQLAAEFGFVAPSVRIVDNLELPADHYSVRLKETIAGGGRLKLNHYLAMDPSGRGPKLPGEHVKEPVFQMPATWIDEGQREEAGIRGFTVVDPATVLTTHFTEIVKDHMAELLSFAELKKLIDGLTKEQKALVDDIVPARMTLSGIQRVLQNLLKERVSIRDLPTILEGIAEGAQGGSDLVAITETVRARLARQLCAALQAPDGALPIVTLSPAWEQAFAEAIVGTGAERQLALAPSKLHSFVADVRNAFDAAAAQGETPALVTSAGVRPFVRSLIERFRSQTIVMSQNEIHPKARLRALGAV